MEITASLGIVIDLGEILLYLFQFGGSLTRRFCTKKIKKGGNEL
jgi:hypothetical protein